ncbi:cation-transporting P-type ATPase [Listeria fleischmannii]|uniref:Cation-transporting P-type ATPase N-terminal domain-containing protein n=1 Tax=Listeria fleischmannii FSL S10-1203 TaxID=1265822 RepID=W7DIG0_9LIST|nr:cation-transporting P-type ATPase [Listeria fleischmannii]EUJ51539.1 hypothetical protein MCOL2_15637 [Listeria fleischmannii FSL S10-1203]
MIFLKKVETNEAGLGNSERGKRLAENGSNVLTKGKEDSELKKVFLSISMIC